jgi:hypothetical protein
VEEEYCWAITQVAGLSCCGRSVSSVLDCGFQLDSLVYTCIVDRMWYSVQTCAKFDLRRTFRNVDVAKVAEYLHLSIASRDHDTPQLECSISPPGPPKCKLEDLSCVFRCAVRAYLLRRVSAEQIHSMLRQISCNLHTYLLTPWSRVRLENLSFS